MSLATPEPAPKSGRNQNLVVVLVIALLLLAGLVGFLFIIDSAQLREMQAPIRDSNLVVTKVRYSSELMEFARARTRLTRKLLDSSDLIEQDELSLQLDTLASSYAALLQKLQAMTLSPAESDKLTRLKAEVPIILPAQRQAVVAAMSGSAAGRTEATRLLNDVVLPGQDRMIALYQELISLQQSYIEQAVATSESQLRAVMRQRIVIGLTLLGGLLLISVFTIRRINRIQGELNRSHAELERKVEERTADLVAARDEAKRSDQAKSTFLSTMSHEIRTPMNGVIGLTGLALEGQLPEHEHALVAKAHESATNLLGILNDILDFSKIEAGKLHIDRVTFDLHNTIDQVEGLFAPLARSQGLHLRVDLDPTLPRHLAGDPLRLAQILNNLLSNAIKFTPRGEVSLVVTVAAAPADATDSMRLRFTVRDSGIGMTTEQQTRLFQPFEQADGSTTRRFGGTGLGLVISHRLVEMMGGNIAIDSTAGSGTTFVVELPFAPAAARPDDGEAPATSLASVPFTPQEGLHVLLVEDNATNVLVARTLLQRRGIRITVAGNGQEALDQLDAAPEAFDIVLMDLQMPVLDGLEATRRLRQNPRHDHLPVIAMTANVMADDRQRCADAGMQDFLTKPIDVEKFFAAISRWQTRVTNAEPAIPPPTQSSAPAMEKKPMKLPGYDEALQRLGGDVELYQVIVAGFLQDQQDAIASLRQTLAAGELKTARRAAHTLKGLAATIGATPLQEASASLEQLLHGNDSTPQDVATGLAALESALDAAVSVAARQSQQVQS